MKSYLLLLLFFIPFVNFAQISKYEKDKFTGKEIIESEFVKIHSDKFGGATDGARLTKRLWLNCTSLDGNDFLRIKWATNKALLYIPAGSEVIFLDAKGETYKFTAPEQITARKGDGTVGSFGSTSYGLDIFLIGDIQSLSEKPLTDLRIYTDDGYFDFQLAKNSDKEVTKQIKFFFDAINGSVVKKKTSARYDDYR